MQPQTTYTARNRTRKHPVDSTFRKRLFPPMKIGGPIEAKQGPQKALTKLTFPPMKIGGPIEATAISGTGKTVSRFPPMKIGGPIEAPYFRKVIHRLFHISADENRRPH